MAKARARAAARKVKDKWKAKNWYQILAPPLFEEVPVSETLADRPEILINRVTEVSLQDLTNDFRKSHIKLFFKISEIKDGNAHTQIVGHTLTSDYLRRMIRRRRSRVDGIYDVTTRDGAKIRVKPFATTDKRIQNSQKKIIRLSMRKTIEEKSSTHTLNELMRDILDGKTGSDIYKKCKNIYPVRRVDIYKTEIYQQPTKKIEDKKPAKKEKETPPETEEPKKPEKTKTTIETKKTETKKSPEEAPAETPKEKKTSDKTKETKETKEKKPTKKKTTKTAAKKKNTKKTTKTKKKTTTKKTKKTEK